jgi:hypothetical protein
MLRIAFFIECKSSRSKPWVAFGTRSATSPVYVRAMVRWGSADTKGTRIRPVLARGVDATRLPAFPDNGIAYGIVQARLGRREETDKGLDLSYAAMMQCCKAAASFTLKHHESDVGSPLDERYTTLGFPVIVVDGDLFVARLENGNLVAERTPRCVVWARHPEMGNAIFVTVVTKADLRNYVADARSTADTLGTWCRDHSAQIREALKDNAGEFGEYQPPA